MKLHKNYLIVVLLFAFVSPRLFAQAKKKEKLIVAPRFSTIGSNEDTSALSMDCDGSEPYSEIQCRFVQLRVSKKSAEDLKKEADSFELEFKNMSDSDLKKQFDKLCTSKLAEEKKKIGTESIASEKKQFLESTFNDWERVCACLDKMSIPLTDSKKECVGKALASIREKEKTICSVSQNSFALTFKRSGERKWISNPGPKGMCDVVNVATIEHEPESTVLWTFAQTRVTANTDSNLCKNFDLNKPMIYSWKAASESMLNCEVVKFR